MIRQRLWNNYGRRRRRRLRLNSSMIIRATVAAFIISTILLLVTVIYFARDLPSPGSLIAGTNQSTIFYDRNGEILFELYKDKNRIPVSLAKIPKNLKNATIAIEDAGFYSHPGFSISGITRAFYSIIFRRRIQGGSTLTQQLVTNVFLSRERSITRKIKELILAVEIERRYSKDQILELYLNEVPYGGQYWGVESAAKGYFGKSVDKLNLVQSAFLAGLPQGPSIYSPFIGTPKAYVIRTKSVLKQMRKESYITKAQEIQAGIDIEKIKFKKPYLAIKAPHFVFYVKQLIEDQFGPQILNQGIKVKTTLDVKLQTQAETIVNEEINKIKNLKVTNGSLVALEVASGDILAMVGSYDYNDDKYGSYNTAIASRQPGSAVKPITYAAAFEKGYTPATVVMDVKTEFPDQGGKTYNPVNYDGKYHGVVQMRYALANSYNIPAVKTLAMVGIKPFLQKAYDLGLSSFEPTQQNLDRFGLSITLGGGETRLLDLTNAFAVFARAGDKLDTRSIIELRDSNDNLIYKSADIKPKKVLSADIAFLISDILADNVARTPAFGSNSYLNIPGKKVAVKTGTSNDKRDNWTVGYTQDIAVGVWVGNNDNSVMSPKITSGVTGASPIWHQMMIVALKKFKDGLIEKPESVKELEIDSYLGGLPKDGVTTRKEYFLSGTEPTSISSFYKKVKLSKINGKLANDVEIKSGDYDEKEYIVITENDPVSKDGINRWQKGIDEWIASQDNSLLKPPTEKSDAKQSDIYVSIKEPADKTRINNNEIKLRAKIISVKPISKAYLFVNGQQKMTYEGNRDNIEETLQLSDGTYEIVVKADGENGISGQNGVRIGINRDWDYSAPIPTENITPTSNP